jgi:hypothetical protein
MFSPGDDPDALLQDVQIVYVQNEIAGPQGPSPSVASSEFASPLTMKAILMIQRVLAQFNLHSYLGKLVDFDFQHDPGAVLVHHGV